MACFVGSSLSVITPSYDSLGISRTNVKSTAVTPTKYVLGDEFCDAVGHTFFRFATTAGDAECRLCWKHSDCVSSAYFALPCTPNNDKSNYCVSCPSVRPLNSVQVVSTSQPCGWECIEGYYAEYVGGNVYCLSCPIGWHCLSGRVSKCIPRDNWDQVFYLPSTSVAACQIVNIARGSDASECSSRQTERETARVSRGANFRLCSLLIDLGADVLSRNPRYSLGVTTTNHGNAERICSGGVTTLDTWRKTTHLSSNVAVCSINASSVSITSSGSVSLGVTQAVLFSNLAETIGTGFRTETIFTGSNFFPGCSVLYAKNSLVGPTTRDIVSGGHMSCSLASCTDPDVNVNSKRAMDCAIACAYSRGYQLESVLCAHPSFSSTQLVSSRVCSRYPMRNTYYERNRVVLDPYVDIPMTLRMNNISYGALTSNVCCGVAVNHVGNVVTSSTVSLLYITSPYMSPHQVTFDRTYDSSLLQRALLELTLPIGCMLYFSSLTPKQLAWGHLNFGGVPRGSTQVSLRFHDTGLIGSYSTSQCTSPRCSAGTYVPACFGMGNRLFDFGSWSSNDRHDNLLGCTGVCSSVGLPFNHRFENATEYKTRTGSDMTYDGCVSKECVAGRVKCTSVTDDAGVLIANARLDTLRPVYGKRCERLGVVSAKWDSWECAICPTIPSTSLGYVYNMNAFAPSVYGSGNSLYASTISITLVSWLEVNNVVIRIGDASCPSLRVCDTRNGWFMDNGVCKTCTQVTCAVGFVCQQGVGCASCGATRTGVSMWLGATCTPTCRAGYYMPSAGVSTLCVSCPSYSYCPGSASEHQSSIVACPGGGYSKPGSALLADCVASCSLASTINLDVSRFYTWLDPARCQNVMRPQELLLTFMYYVWNVTGWSQMGATVFPGTCCQAPTLTQVYTNGLGEYWSCVCRRNIPTSADNGRLTISPMPVQCDLNKKLEHVPYQPGLSNTVLTECRACVVRTASNCPVGMYNMFCAGDMRYLEQSTVGAAVWNSCRYTGSNYRCDFSGIGHGIDNCTAVCPVLSPSSLQYYVTAGGVGECLSDSCNFACEPLDGGLERGITIRESGYSDAYYATSCSSITYADTTVLSSVKTRRFAVCASCATNPAFIAPLANWGSQGATVDAIVWEAPYYFTGSSAVSTCKWGCRPGYNKLVVNGFGPACFECNVGTCGVGGKIGGGCVDTTSRKATCVPCYTEQFTGLGVGWKWIADCGVRCLPGYYMSSGSTLCKRCPAGKTCDGINQPVPCLAGTWSEIASDVCQICPVGSYCPLDDDRTIKKACTVPLSTLTLGSTSVSDCLCSDGYQSTAFVATSGSSSGASSELPSVTCQPCIPGSYCSGGLTSSCPVGMTSGAGSRLSTDCFCVDLGIAGSACVACKAKEYLHQGECRACLPKQGPESVVESVNLTDAHACKCAADYYRSVDYTDQTLPVETRDYKGHWVSAVRVYRSDVHVVIVGTSAGRTSIGVLYVDRVSNEKVNFKVLVGAIGVQGQPISRSDVYNLTLCRFQDITDIHVSSDGMTVWVSDRVYGVVQLGLASMGLSDATTLSNGTSVVLSTVPGVTIIWVNRLQTFVRYVVDTHVYIMDMSTRVSYPVYVVTRTDERIERLVPSFTEDFSLLFTSRFVSSSGGTGSRSKLVLYWLSTASYYHEAPVVTIPTLFQPYWKPPASMIDVHAYTGHDFLVLLKPNVYILSLVSNGANEWSMTTRLLLSSVPVSSVSSFSCLLAVNYPDVVVIPSIGDMTIVNNYQTANPSAIPLRMDRLGDVRRVYSWSCEACGPATTSVQGSESKDMCVDDVCSYNHWCDGVLQHACPTGTISPANTFSQGGCRCVDGTRPSCVNAFSYICGAVIAPTGTFATIQSIQSTWTDVLRSGIVGTARHVTTDSRTGLRDEISSAQWVSGANKLRLLGAYDGLYRLDTFDSTLVPMVGVKRCLSASSWVSDGCIGESIRTLVVTGTDVDTFAHFTSLLWDIQAYQLQPVAGAQPKRWSKKMMPQASYQSSMRWIKLSNPGKDYLFILSVNGFVGVARPATATTNAEFLRHVMRSTDATLRFAFSGNPSSFLVTSDILSAQFPLSTHVAIAWSRETLLISVASFTVSGSAARGDVIWGNIQVPEEPTLISGQKQGVISATLTGPGSTTNRYLVAVTTSSVVYIFNVHQTNLSLSYAYTVTMDSRYPVETMWVDPGSNSVAHISSDTADGYYTHPSTFLYVRSTWGSDSQCDPSKRSDMFTCGISEEATLNISLVECMTCNDDTEYGYLEECYMCPSGSSVVDTVVNTSQLVDQANAYSGTNSGVIPVSFYRNCIAGVNRHWDWLTDSVALDFTSSGLDGLAWYSITRLATCENNPSLAGTDIDAVYCENDKRVLIALKDDKGWDSVYLVNPEANPETGRIQHVMGLTFLSATVYERMFRDEVSSGIASLHDTVSLATKAVSGNILGLLWVTMRWIITVESTRSVLFIRRTIPETNQIHVVTEWVVSEASVANSVVTLDQRTGVLYVTSTANWGQILACNIATRAACFVWSDIYVTTSPLLVDMLPTSLAYVSTRSVGAHVIGCDKRSVSPGIRNRIVTGESSRNPKTSRMDATESVRFLTDGGCTIAPSKGDDWVVVGDNNTLFLFDTNSNTVVSVIGVATRNSLNGRPGMGNVDGYVGTTRYTAPITSIAVTASTDTVYFVSGPSVVDGSSVLRRSRAVTRLCPDGRISLPNANSSLGCLCPVGEYMDYADSICRPAQIGFFANGSHQTPCGAEYTTVSTGSVSVLDCVCVMGYQAVYQALSLVPACVPCPSGSYKNSIGNVNCIQCPGNTYSLTIGAHYIDSCLCAAGYTPDASSGGSGCTLCPYRSFHPGGVSVALQHHDMSTKCKPCYNFENVSFGMDYPALYRNSYPVGTHEDYWGCLKDDTGNIFQRVEYIGSLYPNAASIPTASQLDVNPLTMMTNPVNVNTHRLKKFIASNVAIDEANGVIFFIVDSRLMYSRVAQWSTSEGPAKFNLIYMYTNTLTFGSTGGSLLTEIYIGRAPHHFVYVSYVTATTLTVYRLRNRFSVIYQSPLYTDIPDSLHLLSITSAMVNLQTETVCYEPFDVSPSYVVTGIPRVRCLYMMIASGRHEISEAVYEPTSTTPVRRSVLLHGYSTTNKMVGLMFDEKTDTIWYLDTQTARLMKLSKTLSGMQVTFVANANNMGVHASVPREWAMAIVLKGTPKNTPGMSHGGFAVAETGITHTGFTGSLTGNFFGELPAVASALPKIAASATTTQKTFPSMYHSGKKLAVVVEYNIHFYSAVLGFACPAGSVCYGDTIYVCQENATASPVYPHACRCNAGYFESSVESSMSVCSQCTTDFYCINGDRLPCPTKTVSLTGSSSLQQCLCLTNTYVQEVSFNYTSGANFTCSSCPVFSGTSGPGARQIAHCMCDAGRYMYVQDGSALECRLAPVGFYAPVNTTSQTLRSCAEHGGSVGMTTRGTGSTSRADCVCPANFYENGVDSELCLRCPVGVNAPSMSPIGSVSVHECVCIVGQFVSFDSSYPPSSPSYMSCNPCPIGYYCDGTDTKYACPVSSLTLGVGRTNILECVCNAETFGVMGPSCLSGDATIDEQALCCKSCGANAKSVMAVESSVTYPIAKTCACNSGYERMVGSTGGNIGDNTGIQCVPCAVDHYCTDNGNVGHTGSVKTPCPSTSWTNGKVGATSVTECVCRPGHYATNQSPFGLNCVQCPSNSVQLDPTFLSVCTCNSGYVATFDASSMQCVQCVANYFCQLGVAYECPPNSRSSVGSSLSTQCTCNTGYIDTRHTGFNPTVMERMNKNMTCALCPNGFFCNHPKSANWCPSYSISGDGVRSTRTHCTPILGYTNSWTNNRWAACTANSYCPTPSTSIPCPARSTSPSASYEQSQCVCGVGLYKKEDTQIPSWTCLDCPVGFYCVGNNTARRCPVESTSYPGSDSITDCLCQCVDGIRSYYRQGDACLECPVGRYCVNNTVKECPVNSYCVPTSCSPIQCAVNRTTATTNSTGITNCSCIPDHYSNGSMHVPCIPCPYNYRCIDGVKTGPIETLPFVCPGVYVLRPNTPIPGTIADCACIGVGTYAPTSVSCSLCKQEFYCPGNNATLPCPPGAVSIPRLGASSISHCEYIKGYYYNSTLGDLLPCPSNHYCVPTVGSLPQRCPFGSTSPALTWRPQDCVCEPGRYYDDDDYTVCILCPEKHYCMNSVLNMCPGNQLSEVGSYDETDCFCPSGTKFSTCAAIATTSR